MTLSFHEIGQALATPPPAADDRQVAGYSIDTRTLQPGDLFFAIRAGRDGHEFVGAAAGRGAAAAVVDRSWRPAVDPAGLPLFRVDDTRHGLQRLAAWAGKRWGGPIAAITGSNGKTTTKEACAACLGARYRTAKTEGNLNNDLGLPLSILRASDDAEVAVFEIGMNHGGEIRRLAQLARPRVGVVTNVSFAHVGNFKGVEEIAAAKRELIEELGTDATAVLNADDQRVLDFAAVHAGPTRTFSLDADPADFGAELLDPTQDGLERFRLLRNGEPTDAVFTTQLAGRHNIANLLAAIAAAEALGVEPLQMVDAVQRLSPGAGRGRTLRLGGVEVIDDCYNSNPAALEATIGDLASRPAQRRVAVLGEMRELGAFSKLLHQRAGAQAVQAGLDLLVAVGDEARWIVEGAVEAGMSAEKALLFLDAEAAGAALADLVRPGDLVLFKGSRGVRLEAALAAAFPRQDQTRGVGQEA